MISNVMDNWNYYILMLFSQQKRNSFHGMLCTAYVIYRHPSIFWDSRIETLTLPPHISTVTNFSSIRIIINTYKWTNTLWLCAAISCVSEKLHDNFFLGFPCIKIGFVVYMRACVHASVYVSCWSSGWIDLCLLHFSVRLRASHRSICTVRRQKYLVQ